MVSPIAKFKRFGNVQSWSLVKYGSNMQRVIYAGEMAHSVFHYFTLGLLGPGPRTTYGPIRTPLRTTPRIKINKKWPKK